MQIYLLSFILITPCLSERLLTPEIITQTHNLEDIKLKMAVGQDHLHYFNNSLIYDIGAFFENDSKNIQQQPQNQKNGLIQDPEQNEEVSGCFPKSRRLDIQTVLVLPIFRDIDHVYLTDMESLPHLNSVYVLADNFMIHEIRLVYREQDIVKASLQQVDSFDLKPFIKNSTNKLIYADNPKFVSLPLKINGASDVSSYDLYVFTPYGALRLTAHIEKPIQFAQFYSIQQREHILDVHQVGGRTILVAAGNQGVDIYTIQMNMSQSIKDLIFEFNFDAQQFNNLHQINVIDVSFDNDSKYVIALEANSGIYFFDLKEKKLAFHIAFPRVIAFSHIKNTYMIIAETFNGLEYVAELFIDTQKQSYFFNRIYMEDTDFKHIEMNEIYAILVSGDDHVVIQHSIYNEFISKSEEIITNFNEQDLIRFEYLKKAPTVFYGPNHKRDYYIGLAKGEFKIFEVNQEEPGIRCKFSKKQEGEQVYNLVLNASKCDNSLQPINPFSQCKITQRMLVNVQVPLVESDKRLAVWVIILIIMLTFSITGSLVYCCYLKWKNRIQELRHQLAEKKKYSQFSEVEVAEVSSMILRQDK